MITFTMRVDGATRVLAKFQHLETRLADWRPLWPEFIAIYQDVTNQAFDTEGASTAGGKWKPLKDRTIKERERRGFGAGPILQRTQALRRAVTLPRVAEASGIRLQLNVDSDIYPYHQSRLPRTIMPRRAMVSFTSGDRARFREAALLYVNRTIASDIANTPDDFA